MKESPRVHAWVTKYALTQGILEKEIEVHDRGYASYGERERVFSVWLRPEDWWDNEADARERVRKMVRAKLVSLDKQRAKMVELLEKYEEKGK